MGWMAKETCHSQTASLTRMQVVMVKEWLERGTFLGRRRTHAGYIGKTVAGILLVFQRLRAPPCA